MQSCPQTKNPDIQNSSNSKDDAQTLLPPQLYKYWFHILTQRIGLGGFGSADDFCLFDEIKFTDGVTTGNVADGAETTLLEALALL